MLRAGREGSRKAQSATKSVKMNSRHCIPNTNAESPKCARLLAEKEKSMCKKSKTKGAKPIWQALRANSEGPKMAFSITNSENTKPAQDSPKSSIVGPERDEDCSNIGEPGCKKSNANDAESDRARLCENNGRPSCATSKINEQSPILDMPITNGILSTCPDPCGRSGKPMRAKSGTEEAKPEHAMLCTDKKGPGLVLSVTSSGDTKPKHDSPVANTTRPK